MFMRSLNILRMPFKRNMTVAPIIAWEDNYMYVINSKDKTILVDPLDPNKILKFLKVSKLPNPEAVLITHHHPDHTGGNPEIKRLFKNAKFYAGCSRSIEMTDQVGNNDIINIGDLTIKCLHTPGHTSSHISYHVVDNSVQKNDHYEEYEAVFTGDTLFAAGVGLFLEGPSSEMYHTLYNIFGHYNKDMKFYVGHEYTITNLKFGLLMEPDNIDMKMRLEWAINQRRKNLFTVPTKLKDELKTNIFMRAHLHTKKLGCSSDNECLQKLRDLKNSFRE